VNYLEAKACPKIDTLATKRMHISKNAPTTSASAPAPVSSPPGGSPTPPAPVPSPAPPVKNEPVKEEAKKMGRPKKPVDPNAKPKKPPTAYNLLVGKYRKQGLTFAEAVKVAKDELAKNSPPK